MNRSFASPVVSRALLDNRSICCRFAGPMPANDLPVDHSSSCSPDLPLRQAAGLFVEVDPTSIRCPAVRPLRCSWPSPLPTCSTSPVPANDGRKS
jgi:hypothetical protein